MKHPVIYDNVTWRFWRYKMDISRCSIRTVTRGQKRSKFDIVACLLHYSDNQKWLSYGKIKTSDRNAKRLFSNDHQFSIFMKIWWRHYDVTGHSQVFFYSLENWSSFQKQSPLDWSIYKWNLSFRPKLRGPRGHNVRTVYIKLSEEIEKSTYHMTDTVELLNIWLVIYAFICFVISNRVLNIFFVILCPLQYIHYRAHDTFKPISVKFYTLKHRVNKVIALNIRYKCNKSYLYKCLGFDCSSSWTAQYQS